MSSRTLNRKDFLILGVSSAALSALVAACGGDDPVTPPATGGTGATGGGGSGTAGTGATTGGAGMTSTGGTTAAGTSSGGGGTGGASGGSGGASGGSGGASGGSGGASGGTGGASGGTGGGGSGGGGGMCNANIMVTSSPAADNHTHTLMIPMADIAAGADKTYQTGMGGGGNHTHWVTVTAADFTALKGGGEVKKQSCGQGPHQYVLKCGGGGSAAVAPTGCNGNCGSAMNNTCQ